MFVSLDIKGVEQLPLSLHRNYALLKELDRQTDCESSVIKKRSSSTNAAKYISLDCSLPFDNTSICGSLLLDADNQVMHQKLRN